MTVARLPVFGALIVCACGRLGFDEAPDASPVGVSLSYPTGNIEAVLGTTPVMLTPHALGAGLSFSVTPALPAGLVIDPSTGVIAGVPSESVDNASFTVTASSAHGSATFPLVATVLPGYEVDSTRDDPDDNDGTDAVCHATAANGCTLRAAIQTVNRRTGKQLVLLPAGDYVIGSSLEAVGNDFELAGAGAGVTLVHPPTVHPGYGMISLPTAHHLSLEATAFADFGSVDGAVVSVTAGILDVEACAFTNNDSAGSGGVLFIANGASATLLDSTFTSNTSFGGCCGGWGGVIDGEGSGTTIHVARSTATLNATAWGGFSHITSGTTLVLESSTIDSNTSTISGALATPGGVYTLINDTITHNTNTNPTPDSSDTASAGIYLYSAPCHYTLVNTLIAFNTDTTGAERNCNRRDLTTSLTSNGGNLLSDDGRNCAMYLTGPGDRLMADPGLDPGGLADHGGPTQTILLVPGSAAIDTGESAGCPATDQRGMARPANGACDVGAVEMQ